VRVDEAARHLRALEGESRRLAQLRADVAIDLLRNAAGPAGSGKPAVAVTIPVLTLLGHGDEPAILDGYGPIDRDTAARLAGDATSWVRILTHPVTGTVLDLERIEDASERAGGLVRQLLAFSRRQVLQPKVLDLNAIVEGLDKLLRRLMDEAIEMQTVVGRELGRIKADPGQIEQVIMNLVVNARDAMPDGGRLTVETENVDLGSAYARDHATVRPGRYVMLAVSDTGMGMSPDTIAHIFEPFYTTKESGRGTGLGLSTVYGIVKQSGGYIWVYSEPGHGTTFKVYLPRVEEAVESLPVEKSGEGDRKRTGTETILLVEDEPQLRELTRSVLQARGYEVVEAKNSAEAEQLAEKYGAKIHLLLTDVIMPGASGRHWPPRR